MKNSKLLWSVLAAVGALILCFSSYGLWQLKKTRPIPEVLPLPEVSQAQPSSQDEKQEEVIPPTVKMPAAFATMTEKYPDIYAWIQMPGTSIDYPIVQRFGDDSYYLQRDLDGKHDLAGSLFTEYRYNTKDFNDPVTVIYGHHMRDGSMFGTLQSHIAEKPIDENDLIYIYLPTCRKTYQIFAAVPYDPSHILYYHNFHEEKQFDQFFDTIMSNRSLSSNINQAFQPKWGDRVLILSTCLAGDNTHRFLVLARETQEEPVT